MTIPANLTAGDEFTDENGIDWLVLDVIDGPNAQYALEEVPVLQSKNLVAAAGHALTSGDVGKPIVWKADGSVAVWNDTLDTEYPAALLCEVVSASLVRLTYAGERIAISTSLLQSSMPVNGSDTNSRYQYWDLSAGKYVHTCPSDSAVAVEVIAWVSAGSLAGTANVIALLPARPQLNI